MHPDTDTEPEWEEDMNGGIEYQTLVSSASNDPVAEQALPEQLYEVYWQAKRRWGAFIGRPANQKPRD
eukprot:12939134-Prorocentrum_lima.AAC.1